MDRGTIHSIELENVTLGYPGAPTILENINWQLQAPGVYSIRGGRGSGKSSLARLIAGLVSPTTGTLKFNDDFVSEMSFEEFLPFRHNIGYSFDFGGLINNRTIVDNLFLPLNYHRWFTGQRAKDRVEFLLKNFGLESVRNERPFSISGGMRKEACVARAFVMEPEVVILDEPITGLNPPSLKFLKSYLKECVESGKIKLALVFSDDDQLVEGLNASTWVLKNKKLEHISGPKSFQGAA